MNIFKLLGIGLLLLCMECSVSLHGMNIPSTPSPTTEQVPVHGGGAPQEEKGIPAMAIAAGIFVLASTAAGYVYLSDDDRGNDDAGRWLMVPAVSIGLGWVIATIGY